MDFGREALPHETGVLSRRVSFRKGCYLGQEVVARMESLGKPKRRLVALRMEQDRLPVSGAEVALEGGEVVGSVTSSSPAPMLGSACVAFAMVRLSASEAGSRLRVAAEGDWAIAVVQPRLRLPARRRGVSVEPEFILFAAAAVLTLAVLVAAVLLLRKAFREERRENGR